MSTRSLICKENADHTYTGIYCHWGGYPEHNGRLLVENYDTPEKVDELLALGDLSILEEHVAPPEGYQHSFEHPLPDVCVAYHRDRGEEFNPPSIITTKDYQESWCEYMYVFGLDHKWRYFTSLDSDDQKPEIFTAEWANGYYNDEPRSKNNQNVSFDCILNGAAEDDALN